MVLLGVVREAREVEQKVGEKEKFRASISFHKRGAGMEVVARMCIP